MLIKFCAALLLIDLGIGVYLIWIWRKIKNNIVHPKVMMPPVMNNKKSKEK